MPTEPNREETLFAEAQKLTAAEQAGFLDRACADDPALRQRVEALLKAHAEAGTFIDKPAVEQGTVPLSTSDLLSRSEQGGERIGRTSCWRKSAREVSVTCGWPSRRNRSAAASR